MTMLSIRKKIGIAALVASSLAFPLAAQARYPEAYFLGRTQLSYNANDRDVIRLGACPPRPRISSLKIAARRGDADIKLVRVRFGNNRTEELRVRSRINQGSETRWIDLNGNKRCVTDIVVIGDTVNSSSRPATLEIYGR